MNIPLQNTISQRPSHIGERQGYGHWECDLIAFRKEYGRHNITTLVERRSRYLIMIKNPSRSSTGILAGLAEHLEPLPPPMRQSITFDRGTEFAFFATLKRSLEIESYFCKPQAPWQKGTVENTNGRLRRFLPSYTDIALIPLEKLLEFEHAAKSDPAQMSWLSHTGSRAWRANRGDGGGTGDEQPLRYVMAPRPPAAR